MKIDCADGRIPCSIVFPDELPAPAVIVLGTIYGTDEELERVLIDYAEIGFLSVAPDQFWRIHPGTLSHSSAPEHATALERYSRSDFTVGMADLTSVVSTIRHSTDCTGRVRLLGYCYGGRYAFAGAARFQPNASASFHGMDIGQHLHEASRIHGPIELYFGAEDEFVSMSEVDATKSALAGRPLAEVVIYPGAGHGFTSPSKATYNATAANASQDRARSLMVKFCF